MITQIATGVRQIQLGDPSPTRDFNYVEDSCRGFIALAECDAAVGETVNIGSNFEISVGDLFNRIKKLMRADVEWLQDQQRIRPEKSEVHRLWCDNSKIEQLTGFKPQVAIDEGLGKTVDWITSPYNLRRYKSEIYNL